MGVIFLTIATVKFGDSRTVVTFGLKLSILLLKLFTSRWRQNSKFIFIFHITLEIKITYDKPNTKWTPARMPCLLWLTYFHFLFISTFYLLGFICTLCSEFIPKEFDIHKKFNSQGNSGLGFCILMCNSADKASKQVFSRSRMNQIK